MIFRFDDISANTDMNKTIAMADWLKSNFKEFVIWFCISPLCHKMDNERVFPQEIKPLSDHREFYKVSKCFVPECPDYVIKVNHGLIHVDNRLLSKEAQEINIIVGASLTRSKIYVPAFNHWNKDTEEICKEQGITLVKYEEGWKNLEYIKFDRNNSLWYIHSYQFTYNKFIELFK
jgi:hypothetical protein